MENTGNGLALPVDMGWRDIGSWRSVWEFGEKDGDGNLASGDVVLRNVRNSLVRADSRLVVAAGVDGLTIVETRDAVLVSTGADGGDLKAVVEELARRGRTEHLAHPRQYRPWGHFEVIRAGKGFQVKEIVVKPGARLSLQRHKHRSEHWVVVAGVAAVTLGGETLTLRENQSVYIPAGTDHRLANDRDLPLAIIEIQTGDYLGEDDIIRLDDDCGRA
jgi:mannose-1-phosphate guanylyltransferase/mannose-6-phosphate isomerase